MHKHTPGPWQYDGDYIYAKSIEGYVANPNTEDIQSGRCVSSKDAQAVIDANARLIAAAPDLLNALTKLLEIGQVFPGAIELNVTPYDFSIDFEMWEKEARLAIAKATGEELQATS